MAQTIGGKFKGKRTFRKRNTAWYNKKYNAMQIAGKALSGVKYLKTMINAEKKYHDVTFVNVPVNNAGNIYSLSNIDQGDSSIQRDGKSILCNSVFIRGSVNVNVTGTSNVVRLMIIRDTMNTGSLPVVSDVLDYSGTVLAPMAPISRLKAGRFQVLWSQVFTMSTAGNQVQLFKKYIKVEKHIKYTGPLGTDEYKGQLFLLTTATAALDIANPYIDMTCRTGFYDN